MKLCDDNNIEWIVECEHGLKVLYVNDLSEKMKITILKTILKIYVIITLMN